MPFGHECEYETFDDCVADQQDSGHDEESARRICGRLQADTEDQCSEGSMKTRRYRKVIDAALNTPWAIKPSKLAEIKSLLELKAQGVRLSEDQIRERIGAVTPQALSDVRPLSEEETTRISVLNLFGTVSHRANFMQEISGGTSTEQFSRAFREAVNDESISAIVINVDSPGGTVPGVTELSEQIFQARGTKRIVAVANSTMASAAYWIASAADEIVAAPSALDIGSIGVLAMHTDQSGADEKLGLNHTLISTAKFKDEGNEFEPLSEDARKHMEERIAAIHQTFVADVARNRGVSTATVESDFGQGRTFLAEQAQRAGMVDRIATFEDIVGEIGAQHGGNSMARSGKNKRRHARGQCNSISAGENGARFLNDRIDELETEERSRSDIIDSMANEAGIEPSTVNQILNAEIDCPPLDRLEGFGRALDTSTEDIVSAFEEDGCEYGEDDNDDSASSKKGTQEMATLQCIRSTVDASSLSDEAKDGLKKELAVEADQLDEQQVRDRVNQEVAKAANAGVDPADITAAINLTSSLSAEKKLELIAELHKQAKTLSYSDVLERINKEAQASNPPVGASRVQSTRSEVDKFHAAARDAVLCRTWGRGSRPDQVYDFRSGMYQDWEPGAAERNYGMQSLQNIAKHCMVMGGFSRQEVDNLSINQVARIVMGADPSTVGAGIVASSDGPAFNVSGMFSNILLDASNVMLRRSYDDANVSYTMWMRQGPSVPDFKTVNKVIAGELTDPKAVPEDGEFEETTLTDAKETYKLTVWGEVFSHSWQLVINDQLNSFTEIPMKLGRAMRRKQNRLAYQVLKDNAALSNGNNLFSSGNSNNTTGAVSDYGAAFSTLVQKMREQTGLDADSGVLNLMPRFVVYPPAIRAEILKELRSEAPPSASHSGESNIHRGAYTPIEEGELGTATTSGSDTAFYMVADPMDVDTVEYAFLQGLEAPVIEQATAFDRLAMRQRIYQAFAVAALDHRGMQRHTGA